MSVKLLASLIESDVARLLSSTLASPELDLLLLFKTSGLEEGSFLVSVGSSFSSLPVDDVTTSGVFFGDDGRRGVDADDDRLAELSRINSLSPLDRENLIQGDINFFLLIKIYYFMAVSL